MMVSGGESVMVKIFPSSDYWPDLDPLCLLLDEIEPDECRGL